MTEATLHGSAILDAVAKSGVGFIAALPDIVTSEGLLRPLATDPRFRLVRLCKEDEGVSICSALAYCDKRAMLMMQHTGLLDSLNALRAIGKEYHQPVVMMVGLLGRDTDRPPSQSKKYGVRIVEPVLDAMEIEHVLIDSDADITKIGSAIDRAYAESQPVALLIGRWPTP